MERYGQYGLRVLPQLDVRILRVTGDSGLDTALAMYVAARRQADEHPYPSSVEVPVGPDVSENVRISVAHGQVAAEAEVLLASEFQRAKSEAVIDAFAACGMGPVRRDEKGDVHVCAA